MPRTLGSGVLALFNARRRFELFNSFPSKIILNLLLVPVLHKSGLVLQPLVAEVHQLLGGVFPLVAC